MRAPVPQEWSYGYLRWFHAPAARTMVPTPSLRDDLAARGFAKLALWSRGVDGARFHPGPRTQFAGLPEPHLLYVGRVAPEKGVSVLLQAWRELGSTTLQLVIIGDGPLRQALERQAPSAVSFQGWLPPEQVRQWMSQSRALLFPSIAYEGQPIVVLEALAAGLPVLGSRLGGNPELLQAQGPQWLVTPNDPAAWTRALRALDDADSVNEAGKRARKLYEERFNEHRGRRLLEDAYQMATERRR